MIEAAVITGAAHGIGKSFATRLAAEGAQLWLVDKNEDALAALARQLTDRHGAKVEALTANLADPSDQRRVADRISALDRVDLLVNAAGFGAPAAFHDLDPEAHMEMLDVHVTSAVRFCRAVLPGMVAHRRGAIINISSQISFLYSGGNAMYGSTKRFIDAFSRNLHATYKRKGVRIQLMVPAYVRTSFHESDYYSAETLKKVPGFFWMDVDVLTSAALRQLSTGRLVCVPGFWHKITYVLLSRYLVPMWLLRKLSI